MTTPRDRRSARGEHGDDDPRPAPEPRVAFRTHFARGFYHGFNEWTGFRPNGEYTAEPADIPASYAFGWHIGWLFRLFVVIVLVGYATDFVRVSLYGLGA